MMRICQSYMVSRLRRQSKGLKILGSKPLSSLLRFESLKQWNRKRQYTAKSCVRPTTYDTGPYEALGLAKRQGRKCERHMRF